MVAWSIAYDLTNFGAAGLMGAMWLWERKLSRKRERQLTETHGRLMRDEQRLEKLVQVVQQNTHAFASFTETHRQTVDALRDLLREFHHGRTR